MSLSALIRKGGLNTVANAKAAKVANDRGAGTGRLAGLARLALANAQSDETDRGKGSAKRDTRPAAVTAERDLPAAMAARLALANHQDDETDHGDHSPLRAWVCEELRDAAGRLLAVKICSAPLRDHLYVVFDPGFIPPEPLAVYSTDEIEAMADKSLDQVLEIQKVKIVFRGARVIQ